MTVNDAPDQSSAPSQPRRRRLKVQIAWATLIPLGMLAFAIAFLLWLNFASSGEAEPPPYLGELGTPVRGTFVPPTPTPTGARPTPRPRPTLGPQVPGTPEERDGQRRADLLTLIAAATAYRDDEGEFPSTGNNIQTLCKYVELDAGCAFGEFIEGGDVPTDPLSSEVEAGYWYRSDGSFAQFYVSFEEPVDDPPCETDYVEFQDLPNLICPEIE